MISATTAQLQNKQIAQELFRRAVSETLDKDQTPALYLDKRATRVTPFPKTQELGNIHFTILSFTQPNAHIGTAMLQVLTEPSFEITNTLLGNWDTLHELNFLQTENLSQTSQSFFSGFLAHLTSCTNHYDLFSLLTIVGGSIAYEDVQETIADGLVLNATIPYNLPSVGHGNFLITIQMKPDFSRRITNLV